MENKGKKHELEKQFQEMFDKAKELYPEFEKSIATMDNITAHTTNLQDYLNLTNQIPTEISNNQVTIII